MNTVVRYLVSPRSISVPCTSLHRWLCKFYSSESNEDQLVEVFQGDIPRDKLTVNYSRSSGPGGQNVNKLNTKAEVRFHVDTADWLPQRVKDRIKVMYKGRLTNGGDLIVVSQMYRTQHMNFDDAVKRLKIMIREASEIPKGPSQLTQRRIIQLKRKADRKRLIEKKYHSTKKSDRKNKD